MNAVRDAGNKKADPNGVRAPGPAIDPTRVVRKGTVNIMTQTTDIREALPANWAEIAAETTGYRPESLEVTRDGERLICRVGLLRHLEVTTGAPYTLVNEFAELTPAKLEYLEMTMPKEPRRRPEVYHDFFYRLEDAERVARRVPALIAAARQAGSSATTLASWAAPEGATEFKLADGAIYCEWVAGTGPSAVTLTQGYDILIQDGVFTVERQPDAMVFMAGDDEAIDLSVNEARSMTTGPESASDPKLAALVQVLSNYDRAVQS